MLPQFKSVTYAFFYILVVPSIIIVTTRSTRTSTTPKSGIREGNASRLFLSSPIEPPISGKRDDKCFQDGVISPSRSESDPHAFHPPGPTDLRCPCPALNTLANHGYLPRDGKNITISTFMSALQHSETYHLSHTLAKFLATGGESLIGHSIVSSILPVFKDDIPISLHDLALHRGIEHDASVVHKNAAEGEKYAPILTNIPLLDDFLQDRSDVDLTHIARRRVALERVSHLNLKYAEIARGEWALVLGIFGHAHGGKIPADELHVWLHGNRFPKGWHPTHEQTFRETVSTALKIHITMLYLKVVQSFGHTADDGRLKRMLVSESNEINKPQ